MAQPFLILVGLWSRLAVRSYLNNSFDQEDKVTSAWTPPKVAHGSRNRAAMLGNSKEVQAHVITQGQSALFLQT